MTKAAKHSTPLFLERIHARHTEKQAEKRKAEERRQELLLALNLASLALKASALATNRRRSRTRKGFVDRLEEGVRSKPRCFHSLFSTRLLQTYIFPVVLSIFAFRLIFWCDAIVHFGIYIPAFREHIYHSTRK